jgi:hypothetical protein
MEWFYSGLSGMSQEPGSTAYRHIKIKLQPVGDITNAKARFHASYGWITTAGEKGQRALHVTCADTHKCSRDRVFTGYG